MCGGNSSSQRVFSAARMRNYQIKGLVNSVAVGDALSHQIEASLRFNEASVSSPS